MGIQKLASFAAKKAWWTILFWIVLIAASGFVIARYLESALTTRQSISVETETEKAEKLLNRLDNQEAIVELVIVKSDRFKVDEPEFRDFTLGVQRQLQDLESEVVSGTVSFYQTQNPDLVSKNQDAVMVVVNLKGSLSAAQKQVEKIREVVKENDREEAFSVYQSGTASVNKDFQDLAESDLQKAEIIGIPIALVILVLVFGAVVAAFLPVILSFISIALALAASSVFGQFSNLSFFVTNMITMMGLAVGIDYSLFVVSRFREERAKGLEKTAAIEKSVKTASRAVFFSGVTVIVALAGLLLVPSNVFRSLSVGAIFVVMAAVFASLTLLPALLSILGDRVNFLSVPFFGRASQEIGTGGFWRKIAALVMRFPVLSLELSAGLLVLASIPLVAINIGSSGVATLPEDLPSKKGFEILQNEFSGGSISPTTIVVDGAVGSTNIKNLLTDLERQLNESSSVGSARVQSYPDKNLAVAEVILDPSVDTEQAIKEIRSGKILKSLSENGADVFVGGSEAENYDFTQIIRNYTPWVFVFVLGLSFLFLMLVFRSIIVPIKALIMNLLSVGAAYGLLVLVFQKGVGASFFGFQEAPQIEAWIPLFLFAILFGLSMDYHVFLLSRIRERFTETGSNDESVAFGVSTTGRLITGAALIMVAVFAGFASGSMVMFQQVGFGLSVAILFDATIVRSVLVPASMKLLGNRNWYLPSWLKWLPRIGIEG